MMNNNKILTVSYGTFSCTLEGFDDSFDTMKAIAEYFRDLAADDRYFGAEPAQPDADMLAQIAQREVSRRVEARQQDGKILLKAHEEMSDLAEETGAFSATIDPHSGGTQAGIIDEQRKAAASDTEAEEAKDTAAKGPVEPTQATDAATLSNTKVTPDRTEPADTADAPVLQQDRDIDQIASAEQAASAFFAQSPSIHVPEDTDEDVLDAAFTDAAISGEIVENAPEGSVSLHSGESIAEKLERIRAVVSRHEQSPQNANTDLENAKSENTPSDAADQTDLDQSDPVEVSNQVPESDAQAETIASPHEPRSEDTSGLLDQSDTARTQAVEGIQTALDEDDRATDQQQEREDDDLSELLSRIEADGPRETGEANVAQNVDKEPADDDVNIFAEDPYIDADTFEIEEESLQLTSEDAAEVDQAATQNESAKPETVEKNADAPEQVTARLMKMDRAKLEAVIEKGDLEEVDVHDADDSDQSFAPKLAQRTNLPNIGTDNDGDTDVSRLLVKAEQQMAEPEGATRRSAFAHLRAAVAARFADKSISRDVRAKAEENAQAFKSDFADVVTPRRPVASGARGERAASDQRPAPLKLVAEQRVDATDVMPGEVAPRRVAPADEASFGTGDGSEFKVFVADVGANELPDILEAAASYISFVEGQEEFSRPQLMSRVRQAEGPEFSREDGLRCFGKLLRTGKIVKISGGRFAAAKSIGFQPDTRAAG